MYKIYNTRSRDGLDKLNDDNTLSSVSFVQLLTPTEIQD